MRTSGRIRPAKPGEHGSIASCVRAAYSKYVRRIGREPAPMLADYEALVREGAVYVLTEGSDVAGVLVIRPVGEAMLVENVAVHPAYERAGRGRELMRFAEEAARESGRRELVLYTNELMTENIHFYEGLGYREIDRRLDEGYRRVFMSKGVPEEA